MSDTQSEAAVAAPTNPVELRPSGGLSVVGRDLSMLEDIPVELAMELARVEITIRDLLALAPGSLLTLPGESLDGVTVMAGRLRVARGEITSQNHCYGVRVLELTDTADTGDKS